MKDRYAFDDDRAPRADPSFDDAIHLIIEMDQVVSRRNEEQVGFDQCDVEMPGQIATEGRLSDAVAAIDRDDEPARPPDDRPQSLDDLKVGGKNGRQRSTQSTTLTGSPSQHGDANPQARDGRRIIIRWS